MSTRFSAGKRISGLSATVTFAAALTFALAVAFTAARAADNPEAVKPAKPNIVFVLVDSLRAESLSCYGYHRPTTPFIDQLAGEGILFQNYFANSTWTAPTVATLFTGLSSIRHGRNNVIDRLPENVPVLAGVLRDAGYRTLAVTCNPVAGSRWGYQRGFDIFDDFSIPLYLETDLFPNEKSESADARHQQLVGAPGLDDKMVGIALRLTRNIPAEQPFFLLVYLYDPHWDYNPLPEYKAMFVDPEYKGEVTGAYWNLRENEGAQFKTPADLKHFVDLYEAEIRQTDDAIERLVTTLRERGQLKDTDILIISADHGEEFMEHGVLSHGKNLFEQAAKVPGIVVSPGRLPKGVVSETMATHIDWLPTLAKAAGATVPGGLPGVDLFTFQDGQWSPPEREGVFMHVMLDEPGARPMIAIRAKDVKVIRHLDDNSAVAYDLAADPGEQNPIPVTADTPAYAVLLAKLDAWYAEEKELLACALPCTS